MLKHRWLVVVSLAISAGCAAPTRSESPVPTAEVDRLFAQAEECETTLAGHTVRITYPDSWSTNESIGTPCVWFGPQLIFPDPLTQAPEGAVVTFGAVGGPAEERDSTSQVEMTVAGFPARRNEEAVDTPAGESRQVVYQVFLGGTPTDGPTLIVQSATEDEDDEYALHVAVLDRMMATLVVEQVRLAQPLEGQDDLRHGCASLLLAQGVHPRVVMDQLGHSTITLTMNTYSHVVPELQREAANRMEAALGGA